MHIKSLWGDLQTFESISKETKLKGKNMYQNMYQYSYAYQKPFGRFVDNGVKCCGGYKKWDLLGKLTFLCEPTYTLHLISP